MELWGGLLDEHKESTLKNGVSPDCYISSYLRSREEHGHAEATGSGITEDGWMRDKFLTYVAASVLEAGSDTTSSAALAFVLFMLSSPNALKRAREEIDTVVGDHRLPDFDDQVNLPYVVACVKETLRKHPPVPMGVPHRSEQDDIYKGFFIPKGSTVIGNVWAIHMDPVRYPNPTVFDPDRFYNKGCSTSWSSGPDAHDRDHYVFGWGRRFCQGALIAEASLFMICARIIWAFNFSTPKDPDGGCSLLPDADDEDGTWSDGFVRVPKTFPVVWNARSDSKAAMIRKISDDLQLEWQSMGLEPDST
ncbi:hypothetical protein EW026_g5986 [Hermanssonia centrifuga]|uniref:Cytochrome P450 n=1 Tax=Hermanssonia centrifuga TaxID=98765 RepID=A0A4S4KE48_9APHY|nr:hypothetical protein EW026_g5986 [Hermanssonia centrifuga]